MPKLVVSYSDIMVVVVGRNRSHKVPKGFISSEGSKEESVFLPASAGCLHFLACDLPPSSKPTMARCLSHVASVRH